MKKITEITERLDNLAAGHQNLLDRLDEIPGINKKLIIKKLLFHWNYLKDTELVVITPPDIYIQSVIRQV